MSSSDSDTEDVSDVEDETVDPRPATIKLDCDAADFVIHPKQSGRAAIADMDGYMHLYKFGVEEQSERIMRKRLSKQSLRYLSYTKEGDGIFVAGSRGSLRLFDVTQEKCVLVLMSSDNPCYSMCVINKNLFAIGDDEGALKVWDIRKGKTPIMLEERNRSFISSLAIDAKEKFLFATSGDGNMSTYNIKRRKFMVQSENEEHDMNAVAVVKNNKKVTVGTSEGIMLFYNWEEFAAPSDRFPGHENSIECITPINEDIVCTGSDDGSIRAVHILPNRYLGVVGEHVGKAINKIEVTIDKKFIASSAYDSVIKFWSVEHLHGTKVDANAKSVRSQRTKKLVKSGVSGDKISFLSDLEKDVNVPAVEDKESDEDDDDSDETDENE